MMILHNSTADPIERISTVAVLSGPSTSEKSLSEAKVGAALGTAVGNDISSFRERLVLESDIVLFDLSPLFVLSDLSLFSCG